MKKYICIIASLLLLASCIDDDTSYATRKLSEIVIAEGSVKEYYNISKNETLTITPEISQTNKAKKLSYSWEVDQVVVSHEPVFEYYATQLGSHSCRLIVENEDGKTFFPFMLNVVSPYQQGLAILSQDEDGHSVLSFLLEKASVANSDDADADDDGLTFTPVSGEAFTLNNPEVAFADRAIDMVHSGNSLIIACQGHRTADNPNPDQAPAIYYLHDKTFVLNNMLTVPEYADFIPTRLGIPSADASGVAYPVLCENGKVYEFSTTEGALSPPTRFKSTYSQTCLVWDNGSSAYFDLIFWDTTLNALCEVYNGYGPYYCSDNYHQQAENCTGAANYFNNQKIVKMVNISQTEAQSRTQNPEILVITRNPIGMFFKTRLYTHFWNYDSANRANYLDVKQGLQTTGIGSTPLTETTPCVASQTYNSMLFAGGNKIYRWNYTTMQTLVTAPVLCELGGENAVITDMVLSSDHKLTYVAVNDPSDAPKTGSVYVIDTDKGTVLETYKNVSYKPVRMIYKN